jgi:hypothetical protein
VSGATFASLCQHKSRGQYVVRRTVVTKHKQAERGQLITTACDYDVNQTCFSCLLCLLSGNDAYTVTHSGCLRFQTNPASDVMEFPSDIFAHYVDSYKIHNLSPKFQYHVFTMGCFLRGGRNLILTPWSRVLPEKLKRPELLKKFPEFYETLKFITAFTYP